MRIGHGRDPLGFLIYEEGIGVEASGNTSGMELIDDGFETCPSAWKHIRVDQAIAKAKRPSAVKINLSKPEALDQVDPFVHGLFVEIAEIKEVRPAGGWRIPCRRSAQG